MSRRAYDAMPRRTDWLEAELFRLLQADDRIMETKSHDIARALTHAHPNRGRVTDEHVRRAIRSLVTERGVPIVARRSGGFAICRDATVLRKEIEALRRRALSIMDRSTRLAEHAAKLSGQLELLGHERA
jgi:hypothetical protein